MSYTILEARIEYKDNKLVRVTVLTDCTGGNSKPLSDVRAYTATTNIIGGYTNILETDRISDHLLQKVASAGMPANDGGEIFRNWKKRHQ